MLPHFWQQCLDFQVIFSGFSLCPTSVLDPYKCSYSWKVLSPCSQAFVDSLLEERRLAQLPISFSPSIFLATYSKTKANLESPIKFICIYLDCGRHLQAKEEHDTNPSQEGIGDDSASLDPRLVYEKHENVLCMAQYRKASTVKQSHHLQTQQTHSCALT